MQGVAVTLLTEDRERLSVLQHRLEGTGMGRNVFSHVGFPASSTDPVLRQMQDVRTEVVVVDIDARDVQRAISTIELIQANTGEIAIFAVGEMNHPPTIVATMRAGACEFLERSATSEALIEALRSRAHLQRIEFQGRRGRYHSCGQHSHRAAGIPGRSFAGGFCSTRTLRSPSQRAAHVWSG